MTRVAVIAVAAVLGLAAGYLIGWATFGQSDSMTFDECVRATITEQANQLDAHPNDSRLPDLTGFDVRDLCTALTRK
jgi:hypothetical protein